jgi:hypothetical protein
MIHEEKREQNRRTSCSEYSHAAPRCVGAVSGEPDRAGPARTRQGAPDPLHARDAAYMGNFRVSDRETKYLLPPSVDEWLPEKHLARFIVEVIGTRPGPDSRAYRGTGSASYPPQISLGIYGYATGVFSSRKLEKLERATRCRLLIQLSCPVLPLTTIDSSNLDCGTRSLDHQTHSRPPRIRERAR